MSFLFALSLAVVAQLVEHVIGNDEVGSSILPNGSRIRPDVGSACPSVWVHALGAFARSTEK